MRLQEKCPNLKLPNVELVIHSRIPLSKYLNGLSIEAEGFARKQLLTSRHKGFSNFQVLEKVLRKHKLLLNEEMKAENLLEGKNLGKDVLKT